jgi:hypothetical protein
MKRRNFLLSLSILILLALAVACGRAAQTVEQGGVVSESAEFEVPAEAPAAEESAVEAPMVMPLPQATAAFAGDAFASDTDAAAQPGQERLIIRTADMSIVVTDTEDAIARIAAMANDNGGWVVGSNIFQASETAKTGNITIRVPAEGFQSALDAIQALSVEVTSLNTSGQDVTEEFVDLEARLANLEATADRVRAFLDETRNVEEALAVNAELSRLESEIEVLKGRMQYLSQSAAFSTITVQLTPDILAQPIEVGGWQPEGVAREAIEALVSTLQGLASAIIWLGIYFLPIILLIGIPILLIIWFIRRRRGQAPPRVTRPAE